MALDSMASFNERVADLGLDSHAARFQTAGWATLADLAFSTSFLPGGDAQIFVTDVIAVGLGNATHPDKSKIRRLFFEAYTLAAADLRRRIELTGEGVPQGRKIGASEEGGSSSRRLRPR